MGQGKENKKAVRIVVRRFQKVLRTRLRKQLSCKKLCRDKHDFWIRSVFWIRSFREMQVKIGTTELFTYFFLLLNCVSLSETIWGNELCKTLEFIGISLKKSVFLIIRLESKCSTQALPQSMTPPAWAASLWRTASGTESATQDVALVPSFVQHMIQHELTEWRRASRLACGRVW